MTLALLITAAGGAWAQTTVQCSLDDITIEPGGSATTNFNLTNPDDKFFACQFTIQFPQGISIAYDTEEEEYVASLIRGNKHHSMDVVYNSVYTVTVAGNQDFQGTEGPLINFSIVADNNAVAGNYDCYITNVKLTKTEGDPVTFESIPFKVTISGSEPAATEPAVDVTTNAASAQDLFTEASFKMPTFDATVNYMLVRDMQDEANPVNFSGLPSSGSIVVKKGSDGKYQPAEALTIQLIDPLAAAEAQNIIAADGITVKVLVGNGGTPIEYDQEPPITLEAFLADMKPGYYWIKAEPTDENSPYDGTVYSSQFTVVEQYDLTVKPANDFSKGKIESVTVGTETVTPDATTGEATKTGITPDTEVKLKAKRGYVIEKVEAKKTSMPN